MLDKEEKFNKTYSFGNLLLKRQKGKCQISGYKKTEHAKFSEKHLTNVSVRIRAYEMLVFRKIWCALFSCDQCFEMPPFTLSPTN